MPTEMGPMPAVPWGWELPDPDPPETGAVVWEGAGDGEGDGAGVGEGEGEGLAEDWPARLPLSFTDRYLPSDEGVTV